LKLAVSRSQPPVPYGANLCYILQFTKYNNMSFTAVSTKRL